MSREECSRTKATLEHLCVSIRDFIDNDAEHAVYRAPIIDYHHPDEYRQRGIAGLKKFLNHAEVERDYVSGLLRSDLPPKDLITNAPHILAVWDEFQHAEWPIVCISQLLDCESEGQVKVDVVARGGNEWIKVNTIKESRLMAEFREQDSYINDDYDSTSSSSTGPAPPTTCTSQALRNSVIKQAESLVRASQVYPRPKGSRPPTVRYVLNRLEEHLEGGYDDWRIEATFRAVRKLGADLSFGSHEQALSKRRKHVDPVPTRRVLLDLSVVVALCCDSTHQPLPADSDELESRFRLLHLSSDGGLELAPHTNVSKDLRDQLDWEAQHPLVLEMQERLSAVLPNESETPEFWVTQEVKDRLPAIVDLIGGEKEKARAKALFDGIGFWEGSRWEGKAGILTGLSANILEFTETLPVEHVPSFHRGLLTACQSMLDVIEPSSTPSTPSRATSPPPPPPKSRRSKNPKRTTTIFPASRLPSAHTLRTLLAGVNKGMTVLTNNRGAVGKVIREMGVSEGLPFDEAEDGKAVVWVVNPSSLAEWRRGEVDAQNRVLKEAIITKQRERADQGNVTVNEDHTSVG